MHNIGFSTGALAFGNFERGIELQRIDGVSAIELSALREAELDSLISAIPDLDLAQFKFRSFHAPSALQKYDGGELANRLLAVTDLGLPIVVHPDIIAKVDLDAWRAIGPNLLLENLDGRKKVCRTAQEMRKYFDLLPDARFCFDVGHARQIDPTMSEAVQFLIEFRDLLAELHISEVNWECKHQPISSAAILAFRRIGSLIPKSTPVIIESVIGEEQIERELHSVHRCLDADVKFVPIHRRDGVPA